MRKNMPACAIVFLPAAVSLFFFSSCVSMKERYTKGMGPPVIVSQERKKTDETHREDKKPARSLNDLGLRVLVTKTTGKVVLKSSKQIKPVNNAEVAPAGTMEISFSAGSMFVNGSRVHAGSVEFEAGDFMETGGRKYRGGFLAVNTGSVVLLINKVPLRCYLYGVLPSEVPPGWHREFLKAQAVAARTFALYNRLKGKTPEYDLDSTVMSQVYKGYTIEDPRTNEAVDATEGEILTYKNEPIQAFFHANSGGRTATSEEVWGGKLDYLKSVPDEHGSSGRHYRWFAEVKRTVIKEAMEKAGIRPGEIYDINVIDKTGSNRVNTLRVYGSGGSFTVRAKDLRMNVGPDIIRSTNFTASQKGDSILFEGYGWGHGVGLSQDGGNGMAQRGMDYKSILRHFYRGAEIKKARLQ
ncbi:MAG TPA: SpoIID/LytB domain-containing protein [bacterium]|nr:SpoIID/LytB domain-containing protein [bacterium]